jgi:hypothetical protein
VHLGLKIQHNIQAGLPAVRAPKGKHQAMAQQVNNCIGSLVVGGGWGVGGTGRGVSETAPAPPATCCCCCGGGGCLVVCKPQHGICLPRGRFSCAFAPLRLCGGRFLCAFSVSLGIDK